ncbi:hypothetical protein Q1695_003565 [Nippostrongylus brasiliensis]|nr:hypothetical protein Q1695_003565 [Nippostrongylus brasiliensis]
MCQISRNRYPEEFTLFDRDILKHHCDNLQSVEFFKWKMEARCILQDKFKQAFPSQPFQLLAVGSTINGCGSFNSDLDLCLCVPNSAEKTYSFDRRLSLKVLKTLNTAMKINESMRTFIRTSTLIRCKVPILRLTLYPPYEGLDIDLNVNGVHGIYGSHLLHYYARIDDRFAVICLLVKHWAIRNDIGSAKCGSLSSYSIALLVLHFFQCGIEPAVLPNLQQLYPAKFSRTTPLEQLKLFQIMDPLPERPLNQQTVGELLAGFFHYYASFNFSALGISIEKACVFPRTYASPDSARYQLFIEEPFDGTNTARSVTKPLIMTQVRKAFCFARDAFRDHPPSLKRINVSVGNE